MLPRGMHAQPRVECELLRRLLTEALAGGSNKRGFAILLPGIAPGGGAIGSQSVGQWALAEHWRQREQSAGIGLGQGRGLDDTAARLGREPHLIIALCRPAIAG